VWRVLGEVDWVGGGAHIVRTDFSAWGTGTSLPGLKGETWGTQILVIETWAARQFHLCM